MPKRSRTPFLPVARLVACPPVRSSVANRCATSCQPTDATAIAKVSPAASASRRAVASRMAVVLITRPMGPYGRAMVEGLVVGSVSPPVGACDRLA